MRRIAIIVIVLCVVVSAALVSCTVASDNSTNSTGGVTNGDIQPSTILRDEPAEYLTWISPGKVLIGNFYPGARAEWILQVHNGDSTMTDTKLVTTFANEYSASILLNAPLYGDYTGITISSDNLGDNANVISYSTYTGEVLVAGLASNQERVLTITYPCIATYSVTYRYPDHVEEGYAKPTTAVQDWVIIADPAPVLAPRETRDILVVLAMPEDAAVFAPEWEFWVSVIDITGEGLGGGTKVRTELCSRWLVQMR